DAGDYVGVSGRVSPAAPGSVSFNSPMDLTLPPRRLGMDLRQPAGLPTGPEKTYPTLADESATFAGADLLLTNILSFDVRVLPRGGNDFVDLYAFGPGDNPA